MHEALKHKTSQYISHCMDSRSFVRANRHTFYAVRNPANVPFRPTVHELGLVRYVMGLTSGRDGDERRRQLLLGPEYSSDPAGDGPRGKRQGRCRSKIGGRGQGHQRRQNIDDALKQLPDSSRSGCLVIKPERKETRPAPKLDRLPSGRDADVYQCLNCMRVGLKEFIPINHDGSMQQVIKMEPDHRFYHSCGCLYCAQCAGRNAHLHYSRHKQYTETIPCPSCRSTTKTYGGASQGHLEVRDTVCDWRVFGERQEDSVFGPTGFFNPVVSRHLTTREIDLLTKSEYAVPTIMEHLAMVQHTQRRRHPRLYFTISYCSVLLLTWCALSILDKYSFGWDKYQMFGREVLVPRENLLIVLSFISLFQMYPYAFVMRKERPPFVRRIYELLVVILLLALRVLFIAYICASTYQYFELEMYTVVAVITFLYHAWRYFWVTHWRRYENIANDVLSVERKPSEYHDIKEYDKAYAAGFRYVRRATVYPQVIEEVAKRFSNYNSLVDGVKKQELLNSANQYARMNFPAHIVNSQIMADTIQHFINESEIIKAVQTVECKAEVDSYWPCYDS